MQKMTDQKVNLFIIGAMKAGSSSLHQYLNLHPDISMSAEKETNYFLEINNNTYDWYLSQFDFKKTIRGESSIGYSKYPEYQGVPERLFNYNPNAKLIYILRDPIERSISHYLDDLYQMQKSNRSYPKINEWFSELKGNHIVEASRYYYQINRYLPYFALSNIMIVEAEAFFSNPQKEIINIFKFLKVHEVNLSTHEFLKLNQSSPKKINRSAFKTIFQTNIAKWLKSKFSEEFINSIINTTVFQTLARQELKEFDEGLHENILSNLMSILKEDVDQLKLLTNLPFQSWHHFS